MAGQVLGIIIVFALAWAISAIVPAVKPLLVKAFCFVVSYVYCIVYMHVGAHVRRYRWEQYIMPEMRELARKDRAIRRAAREARNNWGDWAL